MENVPAKKKFFRLNYRTRLPLLYTIILSILAAFWVIPLWYVFCNAFKLPGYMFTNPMTLPLEAFTFKNIAGAFKTMKYVQSFTNSAVTLLLTTALTITCSSIAAYGLAFSMTKLSKRLYKIIVSLISLPFQMAMVSLIFLVKDLNLTNNYLGMSLIYTARSIPVAIFIYYGYIISIPRELEEAATVDGCGMFGTFWHVFLPLLKTVTGTVIILRGLFVWNDLLVPMISISKSTMAPLPLRLFSFATAFGNSWDMIFGGTLLVSVPIAIVFLLLQKLFIASITSGAVKG